MSDRRQSRPSIAPLRDFLRTEAAGGVVLLASTVVALVWANSPWRASHASLWSMVVGADVASLHLRMDLAHWVSEGLMTVFFLVVGLEIKREATSGHLASPRALAVPLVAAVGGMVVPAGLYLAVAGSAAPAGWGVPIATDIALAVGLVAVLGRSISQAARAFLLGLAVIDDIGAILVIAFVYSDGVHLVWLALAAVTVVAAIVARRVGVQAVPAYVFLGSVLWLALKSAGMHATLAGVAMGLLAPVTPKRGTRLVDAEDPEHPSAEGSVSVVEWLLHRLHPFSSFVVLPLFALASAGVEVSSATIGRAVESKVAWGVFLGLVVGKPLGVLSAAAVAGRVRPGGGAPSLGLRDLAATGHAAGIGFTVSLFVSGLAFDDPLLLRDARVAILAASLVSALAAAFVARAARSRVG